MCMLEIDHIVARLPRLSHEPADIKMNRNGDGLSTGIGKASEVSHGSHERASFAFAVGDRTQRGQLWEYHELDSRLLSVC